MAQNFPNSPTNGDTTVINGITYTYVSASSKWRATQVGGSGASSGGSGTTTYATIAELPLTGNAAGDQAFVSGNNRLYIWNGTGWYNIALINTAPTITGGGAGSYDLAIDGTPTVITLTATDPEEVPITWTYSVTSGSLTNGGGTTATVSQADNVFTITPTTTEAYAGTFSLTFTASDGVNIATDVNSFTLDFITLIQDSNYTTLLITTSGTTGDNKNLTDLTGATVNRGGSPYALTFSPYRHGGYSIGFDGSNDTIKYNEAGLDFTGGNNDMVFECWFNIESSGGTLLGIGECNPFRFIAYSTGLEWQAGLSGATIVSHTASISTKTWHHVAFVRSTDTVSIFLDGTRVRSETYSPDWIATGSDSYAGIWLGCNRGNTWYFDGNISNARLVKGTVTGYDASTTSLTVPTEKLTDITGTELLINGPNFLDGSSQKRSYVEYGNPVYARPVGPFEYEEYDPAIHGGSIRFIDNTDSVSRDITGNVPGTGDFTVEGWVYFESLTGNQTFCSFGQFSPAVYYRSASSELAVYHGSAFYLSGFTPRTNQWYHIAFVRSGTDAKLFVDGVQQGATQTYSSDISSTILRLGYDGVDFFGGWISDFKYSTSAEYTANFTPPTSRSSTGSAIAHIGTGTDANILDKSQSSKWLVVNGNTISSNNQSKYDSTSIYFDGAGDFIYWLWDNPFGTGSWTIEMWVYITDLSSINGLFQLGATNGSLGGHVNTDGTVRILENNVATNVTSAGTISINTWHHLAFTFDEATDTGKIYIDGTEDANTYTKNVAWTESNQTAYLGCRYFNSGVQYPLSGYVEDFRITKDLVRYTGNFTPPTGSLEG